jgi:O-antigen/teichoic acid export membrane protein
MIPKLGAKGAAISTIFTQFFVLGGQYLLTFRELSFSIHLKTLLKRLSYIAISLITGILYYKFMPISNWIIAFILLAVLFALIAFAFGLLNLKDLRKGKDII